jgi:hypothetical protein
LTTELRGEIGYGYVTPYIRHYEQQRIERGLRLGQLLRRQQRCILGGNQDEIGFLARPLQDRIDFGSGWHTSSGTG